MTIIQHTGEISPTKRQHVEQGLASVREALLALRYGTKPIVTGTFVKDGFAAMREMLSVFRVSAPDLAEKPLAIFDCCPSPPLRWSDLTCQSLIDCARASIPAELISMPLAGATSPARSSRRTT